MSSASNSNSSVEGRQSRHPTFNGFWTLVGSHFRAHCAKDLLIIVGTGKDQMNFRTHKNFLEMRSPELKKAAKAAIWNDKIYTLLLPSVDPKVFAVFVGYLYLNKFPDVPLDFSTENFTRLIELFEKYLGDEVTEIWPKLVTLTTVFKLAMVAKTLKHEQLEKLTSDRIAHINQNMELTLKRPEFMMMDNQSLAEMIKSDGLNIDELKLFEEVVRWARCRPGFADKSLRVQMEDVLPFIRFPLMSSQEIVHRVRPLDVLTDKEVLDLMLFMAAEDGNKPAYDNFPTQPRANVLQVKSVVSLSNVTNMSQASSEDKSQSSNVFVDMDVDTDVKVKKSPGNASVSIASRREPTIVSVPTPTTSTSFVSNVVLTPNSAGGDAPLFVRVTIEETDWQNFLTKAHENENIPSIAGILELDYPLTEDSTSRICLMPRLENVLLDIKTKVNMNLKTNEILKLRRNFNLEPYIFFKKSSSGHYKYGPITPIFDCFSPVDFELVINDVRFLKVNRTEKELLIGFGGSHHLFRPLKNISHQIDRLILSDMEFPLAPVMCQDFKEVILWGVRPHGSSLGRAHRVNIGEMLQNIVNVEKFFCWIKKPPHRGKVGKSISSDKCFIDLAQDLRSGDKLTHLSFCTANLTLSAGFVLEDARKENLIELYTDHTHWSVAIFENFHLLFPSLKRVVFEYEEEDSPGPTDRKKRKLINSKSEKLVTSVSVRLMTNLLKIETIEYIRVRSMDWIQRKDSSQEEIEERDKLKMFLESAGLLCNDPEKDLPYNFELTKDHNLSDLNTSSPSDCAWTGNCYNGRETDLRDSDGYWTKFDEAEFKSFHLSKIFRNFKAFKDFTVDFTVY